MFLPTRRFVLALMVALIGLILVPAARAAESSATDFTLSAAWKDAINPLRRMPVQDTGFVRTCYTFAENYLAGVAGRRSLGKADAIEVVATLLRDPEHAADAHLVKISHPELVRIFGSSRISANQWRDSQYRDQLLALIQSDQEKWMRPLNSIEYQASLVEDIENEFAIVPREGQWMTPVEAMKSGNLDALDRRILTNWGGLLEALRTDNPSAGKTAATELAQAVEEAARHRGVETSKLRLDLFYHTHNPFRNSAVFYLFAALLYGSGMMLGRKRLGRFAFLLLGLGFAEQVIGIYVRWTLAGRAPLSNMYESFTFAVAGMVMIAMILEATRATKLVGLGASILGFVFMVIAHKAPIFDSQIRPLMPALQSSWLTYHVVTIMLSYSAFALSFFVSGVYLMKDKLMGGDNGAGVVGSRLPSLRSLDIFNYRIIAVGFPLLTLGIVFGAVWAATAWGRPWGFDPKETWSAITWLVYAIYLHVRYIGGWQGRRASILSLLGFVAVLFTYLGVNYLLPGLHSYV